jgi:hypothetical protein
MITSGRGDERGVAAIVVYLRYWPVAVAEIKDDGLLLYTF